MTWATLRADGALEVRPGVPDLRALQGAVGDSVEPVAFTLADADATMWVNELGKLEGAPPNPWAEAICPIPGDWTVGAVAFTGGTGPGGETLGLSDRQALALEALVR